MKRCTFFLSVAAAVFAAMLLPAPRAIAAAVPVPHGSVTLISESSSIVPGNSFLIGLHFELEKGWHIYWINPGDSGEPPSVEWHLPAGITASSMEWPAPQRLQDSADVVDFGYTGAVTLLVPMRAARASPAGQPVVIRGDLHVLVCREICVPGKTQLSLSLPVQSGAASPNPQTRALFVSARASLPRPAPAAWKFRITDANASFILHADLGRSVAQAAFFPLRESQIDNAPVQSVKPAAQGFEMTLKKSDQLLKPIAELTGVLVLSTNQAFTIDAPLIASAAAR